MLRYASSNWKFGLSLGILYLPILVIVIGIHLYRKILKGMAMGYEQTQPKCEVFENLSVAFVAST
jgi:hypothetical protein